MLALQLFVVGDLSRGGGWAEVGGEGFPVAGRGVGIIGIFWTLRGEGEATCVTSGLCGGATCCHVIGGQPKPHTLGQEQSSCSLDSGPDGRQLPCVLGPLPWPL